MFSENDNTPINYQGGYRYLKQSFHFPYRLKQQYSYNILLSAYSTIRTNCEEACSLKLLSELSDEAKQEVRENSKISQIYLKSINDDVQIGFDSCLRRCFGKI
jgi:hypothetical protein